MKPLYHIDLCSGIGGFALGFESAGLSKPYLFCEIDKFCQKVLKKHWANVPIISDVKEIANDPKKYIKVEGRECVLTAGYPCQPFSSAGYKKGEADDRYIWREINTIIASIKPSWVVLENVIGHVNMGVGRTLADLEAQGYETRILNIPACAVKALHRRERIWIIGFLSHADGDRCEEKRCPESKAEEGKGFERYFGREGDGGVCGGTNGLSYWVDSSGLIAKTAEPPAPGRTNRIKALGNSIVPQIAMRIGLAIKHANNAC